MSDPIPRTALPGMAFPALPAAQRGHLLGIQFQLSQTQWWTPEELRAAQWLQLLPLLAHAATTSPYYRELFARHGITPPAKRDDALFARIPVSTRPDLQAAGDSLHSQRVPPSHGKVQEGRTSGSSGRPLGFRRTAASGEIWAALAMREYFWQRRDFRGSLGAIRIFMNNAANPPEGMSSPGWGQAIGALYETGQAHGLSVTAHPDAQLDWLERKRPDYLTSFPSNFRALIEHARRTGRSLPPVRELRTVGETLAPEDRALLAEAWCTRITDMYTCEEAGYLALQCPDQPGYHVQAEHVILEVLDDAGRPCAPGEIGRVVLTDLHNFATPFIRYAIGDLAEVGAPCPCGRGLPTLRRIAGRVRNLLRLPDGTRIYPRLGELRLASMPGLGVTHYRVIQRSLGLLELELVAGRKPTEAEAADIAKGIRESIGHPFEVRVSPVDALPAAPNGKFEVFISEVP
jgi:phenylacetate-CoA ligase